MNSVNEEKTIRMHYANCNTYKRGLNRIHLVFPRQFLPQMGVQQYLLEVQVQVQ